MLRKVQKFLFWQALRGSGGGGGRLAQQPPASFAAFAPQTGFEAEFCSRAFNRYGDKLNAHLVARELQAQRREAAAAAEAAPPVAPSALP